MNACLTSQYGDTRHRKHEGKGWAYLTYQTIRQLDFYYRGIVFVLFGWYPRIFRPMIENNLCIELPSPSTNQFGREAGTLFHDINDHLIAEGIPAIDWRHPFDMRRNRLIAMRT